MADTITGNTELVATKRDLIAEVVQRELKEATNLLPTISDMSSLAVSGAKQVSFPKLTSFTAVDRVSAAAGDATALTSAVDTLLLDQNAYVAWIIDSFDEIQSNINAQMEYAQRAASAQGRFVDLAIKNELETVGIATATAGAVPTLDIILEMRKTLLLNNARQDMLTFVVNPDGEEALLKIDEFTRADAYGSSNIPNGMIGRIYNIPIVINNQVDADEYYMYERAGVAIAFQQQLRMTDEGANTYGSGARRFAMDQIFGVKGMELGEGSAAPTESALVVKDGNV